jgi:hypothetical protein
MRNGCRSSRQRLLPSVSSEMCYLCRWSSLNVKNSSRQGPQRGPGKIRRRADAGSGPKRKLRSTVRISSSSLWRETRDPEDAGPTAASQRDQEDAGPTAASPRDREDARPTAASQRDQEDAGPMTASLAGRCDSMAASLAPVSPTLEQGSDSPSL